MVEPGDSGRIAEPSLAASSPAEPSPYDEVLDVAERHARAWVSGIRERPIPPRLGTDEVLSLIHI